MPSFFLFQLITEFERVNLLKSLNLKSCNPYSFDSI